MGALASALGALVLVAALGALLALTRGARLGGLAAAAAGALAALVIGVGLRSGPAPPPAGGPVAAPRAGYLGSAGCKGCHPREHASWSRSFHRTMTQRPSAASVRAPWRGVVGEGPARLELSVEGAALWVELPSPEEEAARVRAGVRAEAPSPRVRRPLALVSGSHHYQVYWVEGAAGELRPLPWVYLLEDATWIPREAAFLQPEGAAHLARWNSGCIQCHAVAGRPRHDPDDDRFRTDVVELGISCEACHGPGAAHAAVMRDPLARLRSRAAPPGQRAGTPGPLGVVLPDALEPARGAEACGQCHSLFLPRDPARFWAEGMGYRPGEPLAATHVGPSSGAALDALLASVGQRLDDVVWPGGTVRIGGREWDGMTASACYQRGEGARRIVCTSCHSMHDGDPDDQLRRDRAGDEACLGCHEGLRADPRAHTRHEPSSEGSRCASCHMPHTSYALLKGIRTHRIASPRVQPLRDGAGRGLEPNACNLCHLDRPLAWAADALAAGWGTPRPALDEDERAVAAGVLWAVAGDAAQRALAAFAMGEPWGRAAGVGWAPAFLSDLLGDPYPAVRLVAARALRRGPARAPVRAEAAVLAAPNGGRDEARVQRLRARRDDRPMTLAE